MLGFSFAFSLALYLGNTGYNIKLFKLTGFFFEIKKQILSSLYIFIA